MQSEVPAMLAVAKHVTIGVSGWVVAVTVAICSFLLQRRKVGLSETDMVLTKWKELAEANHKQLNELAKEVAAMRLRVRELEEKLNERDREIRSLSRALKEERRRISRAATKQIISNVFSDPSDSQEKEQ